MDSESYMSLLSLKIHAQNMVLTKQPCIYVKQNVV